MMKKVVLSLAGVLAAVAFAPEASAIPAFARQTGMACTACHFQHFPALNAFGRAFKAGAFTMIGAQSKVEGEHLSIPSTLNASGLVTAGLNTISDSGTATGTSNSSWFVPNGGGELSLFFGGRISENAGFLTEWAPGDLANGDANAKLPMMWDVGGSKAGIVFSNNGPAFALELLNTGAVSTHRLMGNTGYTNAVSGGTGNHINVTSAAQYLNTKAGGPGFSLVGSGDWGFVNVGTYNLGGAGGGATDALKTTYIRGAATFDAAGWDTAVGVQMFSGTQGQAVAGVAGPDTKATIFDAQMQGEAGGMPLGVYFSMGTAPTSTTGNIFNPGNATDRKSTNIAAELGVIPHVATVQLAYRIGKNGGAAGSEGDNGLMIGATYELAMNVELSLAYTANSGNAYNGAGPVVGKSQTTLLIEALF